MRQEFDVVANKATRAQQEYEAQLIKVERLARESSQKSAALKVLIFTKKKLMYFYLLKKRTIFVQKKLFYITQI